MPRLFVLICLTVAVALGQNPVPQILGPVEPQAVAPGSGAFTLTVYGANFVPGALVNWNYQARATSFISARELQAQILASDVAQNTAGLISVTNPGPGGGASSTSWAQVEVHVPTATINAAYPFFAPVVYAFGPIVLADFNGDTKLDRIDGGAVTMGRGNANFRMTQVLGSYQLGMGATYGDFNGDGIPDIAYAAGKNEVFYYGNAIQVMFGDGTGIFTEGPRIQNPVQGFGQVVAGDFNGDGKLDLIAFQAGPSVTMDVYLGNGDGTFTESATYGDSIFPIAAQAGDFNNDGKLDLLVWDAYNGLYLALGNGDGTFQYPGKPVVRAPNAFSCTYDGVNNVIINDFNGDGNFDVAVCTITPQSAIEIFLGHGNGTFRPPVTYPINGTGFFSAVAGDFNSDGRTDIAVTQESQFSIFLGNGDGTFQPQQIVKLSGAKDWNGVESGFSVGDLNNDGLLDFIFVGFNVFRQQ